MHGTKGHYLELKIHTRARTVSLDVDFRNKPDRHKLVIKPLMLNGFSQAGFESVRGN